MAYATDYTIETDELSIDIKICYSITPGYAGNLLEPPEPATADFEGFEILTVSEWDEDTDDYVERPTTEEDKKVVDEWLSDHCDDVDEFLLCDADEQAEAAYWDAGDRKYHELKDEGKI